MKTETKTMPGYGIHFYANNYLISNTTDRLLFQCLMDLLQEQLPTPLDNPTITISQRQLCSAVGIKARRTVSSSLRRLEELGLIARCDNAISICCDKYIALIQHCEELSLSEKQTFVGRFQKIGISVLEESNIAVSPQCRSLFTMLIGSKVAMRMSECCEGSVLQLNSESGAKCHHPVVLNDTTHSESGAKCHHPVVLNDTTHSESGVEPTNTTNSTNTDMFSQYLATETAKALHSSSKYIQFEDFINSIPPLYLQNNVVECIKHMFVYAELPINWQNKCCTEEIPVDVFIQYLAAKVLSFCNGFMTSTTSKKKALSEECISDNEEAEEDYHAEIEKGFEKFMNLEIPDFDQSALSVENDEVVEDFSSQELRRAERALHKRNPYRNKPFIKLDRVKDMVDYLDEKVQSPVDFFVYWFWQGLYDLYCDYYKPSERIDEYGELIEEPCDFNWTEMLGAPLPQKEVYSLAENVYQDMLGAVEQGKFVYGEYGEYEVTFAFDSFKPFSPCEMFQWKPYTMKNKSIPALIVDIEKFYDVEAEDVYVPTESTRENRAIQNKQNREFVYQVMEANEAQLTPIEQSIRSFYNSLVLYGPDYSIDDFTDEKGVVLTHCNGRLPDHIFRRWGYRTLPIKFEEFVDMCKNRYEPILGFCRSRNAFSVEKVVRWNELNGFRDSVAHRSIRA